MSKYQIGEVVCLHNEINNIKDKNVILHEILNISSPENMPPYYNEKLYVLKDGIVCWEWEIAGILDCEEKLECCMSVIGNDCKRSTAYLMRTEERGLKCMKAIEKLKELNI